MPPNLDGCWIIMLSTRFPSFIAKFWQEGESRYDSWGCCSTKVLTNISFLSNIISNSTYFRAHATKFGWVLDYNVLNAYAKFHCWILSKQQITRRHVRELQYYVFDYYFFAYEFLTWPVFVLMPPKFLWMLDHGVIDVHAKLHKHILARGEIRHLQVRIWLLFLYLLISDLTCFLCSCYHIFYGCWTMVSLMYMPNFTNIFWQGGKLGICRLECCLTFCLLSQWM